MLIYFSKIADFFQNVDKFLKIQPDSFVDLKKCCNEYLDVFGRKIGVDTAENEPSKDL